MEALGQRTGKDFSGPAPEISIPSTLASVRPSSTPTATMEVEIQPSEAPASSVSSGPRKRSRSRTALPEDGVTVLGGIDDFDVGE